MWQEKQTASSHHECYDKFMTNNSRHERRLTTAFLPPVMEPDYALSVIDRALDYRNEASDSVRSRLNSVIKDSVSIPGFQDASKAHRRQLREPVLATVLTGESDKLAGELLRCWVESNASLRSVVSDHLASEGMSADGPDLQRGVFSSVWLRHEWTAESKRIGDGTTNGSFDTEDVGLMLCFVSGRVPTLESTVDMQTPLFQKWLDELNELPADAPEWDHVDEFAGSLKGLALEKITERVTVQIEAIADSISEVRDEFKQELRYLELDLSSWSAENAVRAGQIEAALAQVTDLKTVLSEYRPIRPQASSRSEESARACERETYEKSVIEIVEAWAELMSAPVATVDDVTPQDPHATDQTVDDEFTAEVDSADSGTGSDHELNLAGPELDLLRRDIEALSSEKDRLEQEGRNLREDKDKLGEQISRLRDELSQSREMQEHWRRGYVLASAGHAQPASEQPVHLSSVHDALELAEDTFPDRIRVALNSKSNSNTPFQRPDEVFDALAWLATEYHRLRTNPGDAPNFDKLIKEACPGWSYKPKQTEVTKDQFTEWYTTTLDGKTYGLDAHVGKGTSFDPHQTIRLAFDWDDEPKQVIVGYVGRHQKNRSS